MDCHGTTNRHQPDDGKELPVMATAEMCHYCFDTLLAALLHKESDSRTQCNSTQRKAKPIQRDSSDNNETIAQKLKKPQQQRRQQKQQPKWSYTPPNIDCPLFVTWSKLRSKHPPPLPSFTLSTAMSSSGLSTPVTTTASTSNITDEDVDDDNYNENNYDLRGCVGTLSPKSLQLALSEFAITSALHDQRFDPITIHEVPFLRVGVSLLVNYEVCNHCLDWEVGVHGIMIKFDVAAQGRRSESSRQYDQRGETYYSATYLPEVAYEQKWTQQETVVSLMRKAGYRGVINDDLLSRVSCTRYQSSKFQLSYQEHVMSKHRGLDPLQELSINFTAAVAAADEARRKSGTNSSRHCIQL